MDAFDRWWRDEQTQRLLAEEGIVIDIVSAIETYMKQQGLSRQELARRLGKNRSFVSQVLSSERNFTVRTLAEIISALGAEFQITLRKPGESGTQETWPAYRATDQQFQYRHLLPPENSRGNTVVYAEDYSAEAA